MSGKARLTAVVSRPARKPAPAVIGSAQRLGRVDVVCCGSEVCSRIDMVRSSRTVRSFIG